jgi:uncharacterized SAM-binding protein YcdF (DUF218 family)
MEHRRSGGRAAEALRHNRPPLPPGVPKVFRVNSLFAMFGIESWKPLLAALLLPPIPLLLMVLVGARLVGPRRGLGWFIVILAVALLWLTASLGAAQVVAQFTLAPPAALPADRIKALKAEAQARRSLAIVVLGGGVEPFAPEYGISNLNDASLERLRYGVWLGRESGAPIAFSGGVGHAQSDAMPEAQVAARIASQEFARPLRWIEDSSRDTRENAARSVALLRQAGIEHIVLVTHGWHMPRALRAFREAAGSTIMVEPAPMGLARNTDAQVLMWLPSSSGFRLMRNVVHELLGLAAGS